MISTLLDIPADRTDLVILVGVALGLVLISLFVLIMQRARKRPSAKAWGIVFVSLLLLFFTMFCMFRFSDVPSSAQIEERKAAESKVEPSDGQASDTIDTSVSFADIYREFKRNELNAKDLYNGKRYEITAKINGISTSGLLNLTGGATLTMEQQVDSTIVFFTAEFEKEQEEVLKELSVGDTITFIGTCYGGNFTDCEID